MPHVRASFSVKQRFDGGTPLASLEGPIAARPPPPDGPGVGKAPTSARITQNISTWGPAFSFDLVSHTTKCDILFATMSMLFNTSWVVYRQKYPPNHLHPVFVHDSTFDR